MRWMLVFSVSVAVLSATFESGLAAKQEKPVAEPEQPAVLRWDTDTIPSLPDPEGFAGMFAGVSRGALLVAGGANFPKARPWEEGAVKVWYDRIFVLPATDAPWKSGYHLPHPVGYGVSVNALDGVVCLGGGNATRHFADVFLLRWDAQKERIELFELPAMPQPCAFSCGAMVGGTIYVAGGRRQPDAPLAMKNFWALDVSQGIGRMEWRELRSWPGTSRMQAVAGVQEDDFFLFGGVDLNPDKEGDDKREFLTDCYRYDPGTGVWTRIADLPRPAAAAPSPAAPLGQSHIAVVSGDDGVNALRMAELKDNHPGFPADVLLYHTVTDTWITAGEFPKDPEAGLWPPVTTNTTSWKDAEGNDRYVVPSGEVRPGVRTPRVVWAAPVQRTKHFTAADYGVLGVYLATLVGMGVYFSRREKTTGDFFLGGHRVPWWAAGLSIFGTQLSAITFMAIPAKAYRTDWVFFMANMMIVVMAPVVVYCYLPFFRRTGVTTAYEYLEMRFSRPVRLLGSAAYVLLQLGRMGIVLFLPALALSAVTGINVYACIAIMGVLATLYTVLGGIEAVIWTDVLQVFVLLGGAIISLVVIVLSIDGGLSGVVAMAGEADKFRFAQLDWSIVMPSLWVVMVGSLMQQVVSYTSDQTVVQRYLTTPDQRAAARGVWTNAALTIPATIIFFSVGTALWAYYKTHPALLNPTGKSDDIFPWFIAQGLPAGVSGLVIAGLFAAAMSSLDSSMNSMATAITTDFYGWLRPAASDRQRLRLARWLTLVLGVVGTGSAAIIAAVHARSMWEQYMTIIGLFGGGLAGLFALGIFTRRTNSVGAIAGFIASAGFLYWVAFHTRVHLLLYAAAGIAACFAVGLVTSILVPWGRRNIDGLTVMTMRRTGGSQEE